MWNVLKHVLGSSSSHTSPEDGSPSKMYGRRSYLATPIILYVGSILKCSKDCIHESYVRLTSLRFLITLPLYYYQEIQTVYWVFHSFWFFKMRAHKHSKNSPIKYTPILWLSRTQQYRQHSICLARLRSSRQLSAYTLTFTFFCINNMEACCVIRW